MKTALHYFIVFTALCLSACNEPIIIAPDAVLPDGAVYKGELKEGRFHGLGKMVFPDGSYYKGEFVDGSFSGDGTFVYSSGEKYEGNFVMGVMQGYGTLTDDDGNIYAGEFHQQRYQGRGKQTLETGAIYEGEFQNGFYHGQGKYQHEDIVYEGQFVDGSLEGEGRYTDYEGGVYTGEVKAWVADGRGVKVSKEGSTTTGEFENGYAVGSGEIIAHDGSTYKGELEYGQPEGKGVMTYADGSIYEGGFSYGNRQGLGKFIAAGGVDDPETITNGKWRSNKLVHDFSTGAREHMQAELALKNHQALLSKAQADISQSSSDQTDVFFLGVAGDGSQSVFKREIEFIQPLIESRYSSQGKSIVLVNHHDTAEQYPMATGLSIASSISVISEKMDKDDDILFMYLTSHGSNEHELYLNHDSIKLPPISATYLAQLLKESEIKWKVIIISACYAGGFIPALDDGQTLIITAADAQSRSFGCSEEADMTYFGRAFFSEAMTNNPDLPLTETFELASGLVVSWEEEEEKISSNPMIHAPKAILDKLAELNRKPKAITEN